MHHLRAARRTRKAVDRAGTRPIQRKGSSDSEIPRECRFCRNESGTAEVNAPLSLLTRQRRFPLIAGSHFPCPHIIMNSFLEVSIPMDYKNTIITPKTDFPMKAGLPTGSRVCSAAGRSRTSTRPCWEKNKDLPPLCSTTALPSATATSMGHALNKTLKDFIVRSHAMMGYYTPLRPRLGQPRSAH